MFEAKNKTRQKDIEEIANSSIIDYFKNKTVLITGASGLIGSEIALAFLCANRLKSLNTKVIALVRSKEKALSVFADIENNKNFEFIVQDIQNPISYNGDVDYIIHAASETASLFFAENPVETILTAIEGTKNILELAKKKNIKSMVYLSSIEVYGKYTSEILVNEDEYGYINPLSPRSCYPESKRLCENLCVAYSSEYNVPVKTARLTQTFGAGVVASDNRIFAQFAKSAIQKTDIVLHTKGESKKSYCDIKDTATGILTILINGKDAEAYNIANPDNYISIKEMAEMIAKTYKIDVKHSENPQNKIYPPDSKINLDITKIKNLGWNPTTNLEEMFKKLIGSFQEGNQ